MNTFLKNPKNIVLALFITIFGILVLQNTDVVTIQFLVWNISMSGIILLPLLVIAGFLVGFIVGKKN